MKATFFGHACWLIEVGGNKILIDPFIRPNELASHINVEDIEADYIFLTHGHEDHVADAEEIAKRCNATIVGTFEVVNWFAARGIEKTHPMNIGGKWHFDFGDVHFVNALHSSSMPDGSYGGNPGGFVFETSEGNFYHAGDTGLTMDMKLIPKFVQLDFAFLPIGDNFTMGVPQAIIASDFIECNRIIAMHYDTFGYIVVDKHQAMNAFKKAGKDLTFIEIGNSITI